MTDGRQELFRELVPAFDAHCTGREAGQESLDTVEQSSNAGDSTQDVLQPRAPDASRPGPDADGVRPQHRELFDIVVDDMRAYDWTDPNAKQMTWLKEFKLKVSRGMGSQTDLAARR